jgi:small subunit ribosomal protein S6
LKRYEGLFLFDTAVVRDWAAIEEEIKRLCSRIGAELLVCVKYDERKLAYEIGRRKRGTYVLAYFDAPPEKLGDLERDVTLSETVLRALVLRAETLTEERLAQLRSHPAETSLTPLAAESRRHDDDRGGRGHDRDRRGGWRDRDRGPEGDRPGREGDAGDMDGSPAEAGSGRRDARDGGPDIGYQN